MSKSKKLLAVLLLIGLLGMAIVVYINMPKKTDMYDETLIAYLDAYKLSTQEAAKYASFPNEDILESYLESPMHALSYSIQGKEMINRHLYVYTVLVESSLQAGVYEQVYYFVGELDDLRTVYINVYYIPESLSENLTRSNYSYGYEMSTLPEFET